MITIKGSIEQLKAHELLRSAVELIQAALKTGVIGSTYKKTLEDMSNALIECSEDIPERTEEN